MSLRRGIPREAARVLARVRVLIKRTRVLVRVRVLTKRTRVLLGLEY